MNAQLLASVEREVLAWPEVNKEKFEGRRDELRAGESRHPLRIDTVRQTGIWLIEQRRT
jgi:hypothetical protein